jgi:MFS family permease
VLPGPGWWALPGVARIGLLGALYPALWGFGQLATGALSDRWGRKWLIATGMLLQAVALALVAARMYETHPRRSR